GSYLARTGEDPEGVVEIPCPIQIQYGTSYLRDQFNDGSYDWHSEPTWITIDVPVSRGGYIESLFELKILTPELPSSGSFKVRLYELYDRDRKYTAGVTNEIGQTLVQPGPYNAVRFKRPIGVVYESIVVELADSDN